MGKNPRPLPQRPPLTDRERIMLITALAGTALGEPVLLMK